MLELNYVRENIEQVRAAMQSRGLPPEAFETFARADSERRKAIAESDRLNAQRNASSREIGTLMREGKTAEAAERLERAVDLLPEWPGSYSTLGVFYYQTGQIAKAREVLNRFKNGNAGGLDVSRIEEALSRAREISSSIHEPMPMTARQQLLQLALSLAERTL